MRPVFFGLRTAVGSDLPDDCGPTTRAKQGCLLFDRLLFEGGSLVLRLEGEGVVELWMRPAAPGADHVREWELINRHGPPAGPIVTFNALVDSLRVMDVPWAGVVVPPAELLTPALTPAAGASRGPTPSSAWMGDALHRDLNVAKRLEASLAATPFFSRLLLPEDQPHLRSRAIVSPDPTCLSWEQVLELREHGSIRAARRLMHEVLALARPDDPAPMLSTLDVLAEDIGGLLSDALEPRCEGIDSLIVTQVAAAPEELGDGGAPVILMETHSTGTALMGSEA